MWIKVRNPGSKFVMGVLYRHSSFATVDKLADEFSNVLNVLSTKNDLYMLGDFNINTAQNQTLGISKKFLYTLISNGAIPLITEATRVTDRSSTIIDHIITNDTKHRIKPGVLEICNVSDRYPIFCQIDKPTLTPSFKKSKEPVYFLRYVI